VTDGRAIDRQAVDAVGEMLRRAGHELRNALSGVSVNVEVVRSRSERDAAAKDLTTFADRARLQVGVATTLADGILSLMTSVLAAAAEGSLKSSRPEGHGVQTQTELMIYGERAPALLSGIECLAPLIGVDVEQRGKRVILKVLPEGKSHSKE
jgi:signal transduction histidine kinase